MTDKYKIDEHKIDKLANLAIKRGVALQKGQNLIITSTIEALPLVRKIAEHAYKEGAGIVTPLFTDPNITLSRFNHAHDESFDVAPDWLYNGMGDAFDNNTARMAISGDDPMLLSGMNPDKVARANKANSIAYKPAIERITQFKVNWNIVSWPGRAWANRVFPDLSDEEAVFKLSDAIFNISRVSTEDPVAAWDDHNKSLRIKTEWLNRNNFTSLKYTGPGTNLEIGLADGHEWMGGASLAQNGIICNPNIPSEEVFTTPHSHRVEGHVCSTKPLSYQGTLIDEISVIFKEGKIIEAKASKGQEVLEKVLNSDEGSRRLGEVALVPDSSPISQSGLIFFNTLFDENAASHIALGQCYSKCFRDVNLSSDELAKNGGNSSIIHIDWMIGSKEINVDGINANGDIIPVFRKGEWTNI
jgi:aminopeptidase